MSNNKVSLVIENGEELMGLFDELSEKYQKKVYSSAIRKSLSNLLKVTKSAFNAVKKGKSLPRGGKQPSTGNYTEIDKSFKIKIYRKKAGAMVGAIGGKAYKVRWINFGVPQERWTRRGTRKKHSTGTLEKTDFFYKAVDTVKEDSMKDIEKNLVISMDRLVKKYDKK